MKHTGRSNTGGLSANLRGEAKKYLTIKMRSTSTVYMITLCAVENELSEYPQVLHHLELIAMTIKMGRKIVSTPEMAKFASEFTQRDFSRKHMRGFRERCDKKFASMSLNEFLELLDETSALLQASEEYDIIGDTVINKMKTAKDLDQFYTSDEVVDMCLKELSLLSLDDVVYLEPSAGTGSFSNKLPGCIAVDIDPKSPNVVESDFFDTTTSSLGLPERSKVITVGNPPFGFASSLAIRFFNHAAIMSDTIAFVIPKTFRKFSVQNKLNLEFHLIKDLDIPKNGFIFEGKPYDVPCCFSDLATKWNAPRNRGATRECLVRFCDTRRSRLCCPPSGRSSRESSRRRYSHTEFDLLHQE